MLIGIDCQFNGKISFEECLACANTTDNPCQFTKYLIEQMLSYNEPREGISVTSLLGCHRKTYLERRYEYFEPLEWLWYRFRGHLLHAIAERSTKDNSDYISEKRYFKEIHGVLVSGKPDIIILLYKLLQDLKTCASIPKYQHPYSNHGLQVNTYRYLIHPDTGVPLDEDGKPLEAIPIERLEIVYMSMKDVKKLPAKVMTFKAVEKALKSPIEALNHAFTTNTLPGMCDSKGQWQCDFCGAKDLCKKYQMDDIKKGIRNDLYRQIRQELETERSVKKFSKNDKKSQREEPFKLKSGDEFDG
jgi:hypothetical protein